MALFEKIVEIVRDIFNDTNAKANLLEKEYEQMDAANPFANTYRGQQRRHRSAGTNAALMIVLPNLLGFVVGLAVCRALVLHGWWYLVCGVIGALGIGTLKNIEFDGVAPRYALLRNLILVGALAAVCAVFLMLTEL